MFKFLRKIILWYKFKFWLRSFLKDDPRYTLFRECYPRSDLSYNDYLCSLKEESND